MSRIIQLGLYRLQQNHEPCCIAPDVPKHLTLLLAKLAQVNLEQRYSASEHASPAQGDLLQVFRLVIIAVVNKDENCVRFEVFTAVTVKNVFWDIKTQFIPHRRHITSPLQSSAD
jgi:hypothetical protein